MAEYFRDQEGQDVLLFIDNIFRFTQANSEVSHLLSLCSTNDASPMYPVVYSAQLTEAIHRVK